jgi:hypothetical protein
MHLHAKMYSSISSVVRLMRVEDVRPKGMEHPIGLLIREMLIKHGQLRAFCLRLGSAGGTSKSLKYSKQHRTRSSFSYPD